MGQSHNSQSVGLSLWPRQVHFAFSPKNIAVEVGNPLPAAGGHIEVADRKVDLRRNIGPVELREFIHDIGGRPVAQRLVKPDFLELVKKQRTAIAARCSLSDFRQQRWLRVDRMNVRSNFVGGEARMDYR
jgi:hypothetical protein